MSRTNSELSTDLMHAVLTALTKNDGQLTSREATEEAGKLIKPNAAESIIYEATGNVRWKAILHLQSIGLVKAGFIQKRKGTWYLTNEGETALKLTPQKLRKEINTRYAAWKAAQGESDDPKVKEDPDKELVKPEQLNEKVEEIATEAIKSAIRKLDPYQFQDLCAALLRGMGYHTPFISPKGKDGGIDVIAYKDPLGTEAPSILCQVKHRPDAASGIADVQRLMGTLQTGKSVGLFITSGRYSSDAITAARNSHAHIELIDGNRLIELWIEHYSDMDEEDRSLLRLKTIHVLAD